MHRPFYALVVLLETLAGSLLLVKSVHSETPDLTTGGLRGSGYVFAWSLDSDELDQDFDWECCNFDESGWESGAGEEAVGSKVSEGNEEGDAARRVDAQPWSPAELGISAGMTLSATGYDGAYDFAMFDGEYLDVARSEPEIPGFTGGEDGELRLIPILIMTGSATSLYFDAWEASLGGGRCALADDFPLLSEAGSSDVASADVEAEGLVEAPASVEERELSAIEARAAFLAVRDTTRRLGAQATEVWNSIATHPWLAEFTGRVTGELAEAYAFAQAEVAASEVEYQQDDVLLNMADTLDQLGLRLQRAAQQLRYLAAERISAQGTIRHVAQRNQESG